MTVKVTFSELSREFKPAFKENDDAFDMKFKEESNDFDVEFGESISAGTVVLTFTTDETLSLKDGVLSVNTADTVESDNTLPVTSAAVATQVGNIEILLRTI